MRIVEGLSHDHRPAAARGYWRAFSAKLALPLGPEDDAVRFLERVMDGRFAISAVGDDGAFLGCAGIKTPAGGLVGGGVADLAAVYGVLGAIWRLPVLMMLERPCAPGVLLMDGVFVAPDARGGGVGSALLGAVHRRAVALGLGQIRLDVIDENPRARALYERHGFVAQGHQAMGPLRHVLGFRGATTMVKAVAGPPDQAPARG